MSIISFNHEEVFQISTSRFWFKNHNLNDSPSPKSLPLHNFWGSCKGKQTFFKVGLVIMSHLAFSIYGKHNKCAPYLYNGMRWNPSLTFITCNERANPMLPFWHSVRNSVESVPNLSLESWTWCESITLSAQPQMLPFFVFRHIKSIILFLCMSVCKRSIILRKKCVFCRCCLCDESYKLYFLIFWCMNKDSLILCLVGSIPIAELAWCSAIAMDCHSTAQGSIPGGNDVKI